MAKANPKTVVPKLRFPEFRGAEQWTARSIGGLCKIRTGKKDANEGSADGVYPFFTCAESHIYSDSFSFDAEAILIAGNANVGQAKYYKGKFEAYQRTYVLTDFSDIYVPYLYAILSASLRPALLAQVQVSAMSYIRLPMLEEFQVATPPSINEQQKIADCLTSLDEMIAAQGRKVEALKTYKRGLMQQLFPREGETVPRLRFPEFKNAPGWKKSVLGSVCKMQAGKFVEASAISEVRESGRFPCYGGNGLRGFTKTYTHSGRYPLIGRQGALCGNVKFAEGEFHATEHAIVSTPNDGISVDWLFCALGYLQLNQFATGQAQPGLSVEVLEKVELKAPILEHEQQRVADCFSSIDSRISLEENALSELKRHKQALMQQLFPSVEDVK